MCSVILFCGAPADIQYALSIHDKYKDKFKISIFVTNVKGIYKFLASLDLNLENLVFISYPKDFSWKNPYVITREKIRINKLYEKYFREVRNSKVYFFSHFHDWITFSIVSHLSKRNDITFVDHYDKDSVKGYKVGDNSIKDFLRLTVFKYITGIRFNLLKSNDFKKIEFPYEKYGIQRVEPKEVNEDIYTKYAYKISNVKDNAVLLFESTHNEISVIRNYREKITEIVKILKGAGYHIYLKPHPRLGYSKFLENYTEYIISSFIPGEFLEIKDFVAILGVETTAMTTFARHKIKPVYSLINLFDCANTKTREYYKHYLLEQSDGKIEFVGNIEVLLEKLKNLM